MVNQAKPGYKIYFLCRPTVSSPCSIKIPEASITIYGPKKYIYDLFVRTRVWRGEPRMAFAKPFDHICPEMLSSIPFMNPLGPPHYF